MVTRQKTTDPNEQLQAKYAIIYAWQQYEDEGLSLADFYASIVRSGPENEISFSTVRGLIYDDNRLPQQGTVDVINRLFPVPSKLKMSVATGRVTPNNNITQAPTPTMLAVLTSEKADETLEVSG